ncbi:MAG TPA: 4Fe-4S binding protein [Thermoanaerobaculia bacterium]|nr:4Fe-4S binding protein [Thermoanaerobaculia bacterium]
MKTGSDIYRRLQQHIDVMPVGFPATDSGVELRILRRLFTEEEAAAALLLSAVPEPLSRIHARAPKGHWTKEELERLLDGLAEKGAIMGGRLAAGKGGAKRWSKAMLALGMYEFQVDRLTKELQQDLQQYIREGFSAAFLGPKTKQMRTIPVNARIVPERRVGRYDDARRLIGEGPGPWAVINCVCRQGKDLVGEPCRQTKVRRTCLLMKGMASYAIETGTGEALTGEQVLGLVDRAEREGMVLQPENAEDPLFVCFCCGCCCGVLNMAKQFPRPADYVHSNHRAAVDPELCTDCETCRSRCPMEALHTADGRTVVDEGRCIGCGACVTTCPAEALHLEKRGRDTVPPKTHDALYRKILVERFGLLGTAKVMGKAALGRRI